MVTLFGQGFDSPRLHKRVLSSILIPHYCGIIFYFWCKLMRNKIILIFLFITSSFICFAQDKDSLRFSVDDSAQLFKKRISLVAKSQGVLYGSSIFALNQAWYANYPRSSFHFYNDGGEWLKMDKAGHAFTAYQVSRLNFAVYKWAGVNDKKAILYSGLSGLGYQTIIETLDGFSSQWGWSWNDMLANTLGTGIWAGQQYAWGQQKIKLKVSAHYNKYSDQQLEDRTNQYFGRTLPERLLKDYNAQTYWLSANLHSIVPALPAPKWLNIAVGYGAENMFGGYGNNWTTPATRINPSAYVDRNDLQRYAQWYFSLDLDFERIPTKSKAMKSLFYVLDAIKIPAPTLILANGKLSGQWIYF